jgi:hypothetical protein
MSDIDKVLINFFKKASEDPSNKDVLELSEDLPIRKVAFDMYKVFGDHYDGLWKLEEVEGKQFLVRASNPQYDTKESGDWTVSSNYDYNNITLKYKNVPICSFSSDDFGFDRNDITIFKSAIFDMISSDEKFVKEIISSQSKSKVETLQQIFPELIKK